jgi:O-antigen/teichoic acid export membrane protein
MSSAAWNVAALVVLGITAFVTAPVLVGKLGAGGYGLYMLILSISGFAGMLDMGLGEATLRFVARYHTRGDTEGINRVFGATMFVYVVSALPGAAAIALTAPWIASCLALGPAQTVAATHMVRVAALALLINTFAAACKAVTEAVQRYDLLTIAKIVLTLLHAAALVASTLLLASVQALIWCTLGYAASSLIVFAIIARRLVPGLRLRPSPSRSGLREVFAYGVFSFVNQTISKVSLHIDRLLLGVFFGPAQVAWLSVPKDLLVRAGTFSASIGRVLFPRFSGMKEDGHMLRLFLTSTWCLLGMSLVMFVPAVVIMPEFLRLWMGAQFAQSSATAGRILAGSFALSGAFVPYFSLLKGTGRVHWLTVIFLMTTGLGIVASLILVPVWGVLGAAIRSWVVVWCGFGVIIFCARRIFAAPVRDWIASILVVPIGVAAAAVLGLNWLWARAGSCTWPAVTTAYVTMAAILALALWGCNRLQSGPEGPAGELLTALLRFRGDRRGQPDLPAEQTTT